MVLAALGLLVGLIAPRYVDQVDRAREAALRTNLATLRDALDRFKEDRGQWPQRLDELVEARYLRAVPVDPVTERSDTWVVVPAPAAGRGDSGVADVKSGAPGSARDGSAFSGW